MKTALDSPGLARLSFGSASYPAIIGRGLPILCFGVGFLAWLSVRLPSNATAMPGA